MYPAGELNLLAARKALVRVRIAERRWQCAADAAEASRPLAWIDGALDCWRQLSPLTKAVGLPLVLLAAKKLAGRFGRSPLLRLLPTLLRSLPVVFRTAQAVAGRRE
jgi:hypothetical protein